VWESRNCLRRVRCADVFLRPESKTSAQRTLRILTPDSTQGTLGQSHLFMTKVGAKVAWASAGAVVLIVVAGLAWVLFGSGLLDGPTAKGEAAYAKGDWR
jgi:hypothetical protein